MKRKINYLGNRELLAEIHKSKITYCSFIDEEAKNYDLIVRDIKQINDAAIAEALKNRVDRLTRQGKEQLKAENASVAKISAFSVDPESIDIKSLVFRVMTYEHIPLDTERTRKAVKSSDNHVKVNFPPFKHYRLDENKNLIEVGKSHWINGIHNGEFSIEGGRLTNRLASQFMLLVERYSQKGNWRGYCVDAETEALTQRGWLKHNEITETDIILSYENGDLKWSSIKSIYRGQYDGLMHHLTNQKIDALITPNHKMVTKNGLIPPEVLRENDHIVIMGNAVTTESSKYSDAFVELMGWIVTEGNYEFCNDDRIRQIRLWQNTGVKADRIRNCLNALGYKFSETSGKNIQFSISRDDSKKILEVLPQKNLSMEFILALSTDQRELLISTMIDGDGWQRPNGRSYTQKDKHHMDLFQALCAISGYKTNLLHAKDHPSFGKLVDFYVTNIYSKKTNTTKVSSVDFAGGKRNGRSHNGQGKHTHPNEPTVQYNGLVWCPQTEYGSFMARRNGKVYLTGNTYLDDMKGQALVQLIDAALKFDEGMSDNPFSYYTMIITNCFRGILNSEKRVSDIKNKIMVESGYSATFEKQAENDISGNSD